MQVILKPVSHPDLGETIINSNLFSIGRHEPPFSGYPPDIVTRLSRRHARIFEQEGKIYLVDLESLNGTSVNGHEVKNQHVELQQDDQISFAGHLTYRIDILGKAAPPVARENEAGKTILTLIPQNINIDIEPIVVSEFPFLISKSNEAFSRYKDKYPDEFNYLSRRHAHIFISEGTLYIEDLGSTNGTFLSESRLDEHARLLHDDDLVAFGGDCFVYKIKINHILPEPGQPADDASILTSSLPEKTDITRTTFITSADSFLDIFCLENEAEQQQDDDHQDDSSRKARKSGRLARSSALLQELHSAFSDDRPDNSRSVKRLLLGLFAAILIGGAGYYFYKDNTGERVDQLIADGEYLRAVETANSYLASHPDDRDISEQAAKALVRHVIPVWDKALQKDDFTASQAALDNAHQMTVNNPTARPLLDVLGWITDLNQYFSERGGEHAPITVYKDEVRIEQLLQWWDSDTAKHRRIAGEIARYEPAFEPARANAYSLMRLLRSEKATYLTALDKFKKQLNDKLEAGDLDTINKDITDFKSRYPRISGMEKLEQDLQNYLSIHEYINASNLLRAVQAVKSTQFLTPEFSKSITRIRDQKLPPDEFVLRFEEASRLWKNNQPDEAITTLESLQEGSWEKLVSDELERKRTILRRYRALEKTRKQPDYAQELVAFFGSLNADEDSYFINAIEGEFQSHRDKVLKDARQALKDARAAWNKYNESGRIMGLQRLEAKVSRQFRNQAALLTTAYEKARHGADIYKLLKHQDSAGGLELYQSVVQECNLQLRSLRELRMVLEPSLLDEKIRLLPDPEQKLPKITRKTVS